MPGPTDALLFFLATSPGQKEQNARRLAVLFLEMSARAAIPDGGGTSGGGRTFQEERDPREAFIPAMQGCWQGPMDQGQGGIHEG